MTTFQAIRGMVDILPEQSPLWQSMEAAAQEVLSGYGYAEIRLPIIEAKRAEREANIISSTH